MRKEVKRKEKRDLERVLVAVGVEELELDLAVQVVPLQALDQAVLDGGRSDDADDAAHVAWLPSC